MHAAGCRQRTPAARHAVRADPLERGHRDRRARRLAGGAAHRSILRPAREQGDAGLDRAVRICVPRLCAVAHAARIAGRMPGGRASPSMAAMAICSPTMPISGDGNPGSDRSPATISPNTRILAAASIARRRLPRTASKPACSSALRAMPATGMSSRGCLRPIRSATIQRRMLLSGKSADGLANAGPIVCACFGVGRTTICRRDCSRRAFRRRDRRQIEGRHQLRFLHSGNEAADRADRGECGAAAIGCGGELGRPLSVIARSEATKQSILPL